MRVRVRVCCGVSPRTTRVTNKSMPDSSPCGVECGCALEAIVGVMGWYVALHTRFLVPGKGGPAACCVLALPFDP